MTWNDFFRKIGSRKFWALLAVFIPALLVFTGVISTERAEELKYLIVLGGACAAYMFAESAVDVARIMKEDVVYDNETDESDNDGGATD